ncbi:hypothetical protein Q1B87_001301 [Salmonella enterica]|nr:hypothetical protein [Salmonella enterica]EDT0208653.1 hypothetical protein [Salmonella enterica subsp. diarizonae]
MTQNTDNLSRNQTRRVTPALSGGCVEYYSWSLNESVTGEGVLLLPEAIVQMVSPVPGIRLR